LSFILAFWAPSVQIFRLHLAIFEKSA